MSEGIDYAFQRPTISAIVAAGKAFVIRYGGAGTTDKWLAPSESVELRTAGMSIVANVEGAANGLLNGWTTGAQWASNADRHFRACGMPADRPIYLSVDFDVQSTQWPMVASALRGAASVIGAERVGIYGGRNAIRWAQRDGVARWFWQTYAWSGNPTQWLPGVHIQQYRNGVTIGGASCDLDRSLTADFGQWPRQQGDTIMDSAELIIQRWSQGVDHTPDGTSVEPVKWRVKDEAWQKSVTAQVGELLARPAVSLTPEDVQALAAALTPALETAVETVLARTGLIVRPKV